MIGESAGLLFTIKGDSSDGQKAIREFRRDLKGIEDANRDTGTTFERLAAQSGLSASQFTALSGVASLATGAIVAVASAAAITAAGLFKLATEASNFGSEIFDASQKTGLGAETLSALRIAAEQSGSSFEKVVGAVTKFNVLLGEANSGSEKAAKTLREYGVTATDTQEALEQAITAIANMETADRQAAAAKKLFKDRTADILPVIKSFDGDLPGLISKLREMGVLMSDKNAAAADEFGDMMDMLNAQLGAVGRTIGFAVLPIFMKWATYLSEWLARNSVEIQNWASRFAKSLEFIAASIINNIDAFAGLAQILTSIMTGDWSQAAAGVEKITKAVQAQYGAFKDLTTNRSQGVREAGGRPRSTQVPLSEDDEEAAKKRAEERQKLAERDAQAQIAILESQLKDSLKAYDDFQKRLLDKFAETKDKAALVGGAGLAESLLKAELDEIIPALEAAENAQAASQKKTSNELLLLKKEQDDRITEINRRQTEAQEAANRALLESEKEVTKQSVEEAKKRTEEIIALYKAQTDTLIAEFERLKAKGIISERQYVDAVGNLRLRQLEQERALTEDAARRQLLDEQIKQQKIQTSVELIEQTNQEAEAYDKYRESVWNAQMAQAEFNAEQLQMVDQVAPVQQALAGIAEILTNAFQGVANAIGSVVQQWVLYGKTGPAVMRQILAQALASIAAEAAVRAIFELAAGFAALFLDPGQAAAHFIAAGLYGSIAAGSALAGRAVAGNSFNQQATEGAGAGTGIGSGAGTGTGENAQNTPLVFTERFAGFQQQMADMIDRTTTVLGGVVEAVDNFTNKFGPVSPGHVVMAGAGDAAPEIRAAFETELGADLRATTTLFRQTGQYR